MLFICFFAMAMIFFSCQTATDQKNNGIQPDPLDISAQGSSVRPQSDFYLFANGTWLKNTVIHPAQSVWGSSSTLFMNPHRTISILPLAFYNLSFIFLPEMAL